MCTATIKNQVIGQSTAQLMERFGEGRAELQFAREKCTWTCDFHFLFSLRSSHACFKMLVNVTELLHIHSLRTEIPCGSCLWITPLVHGWWEQVRCMLGTSFLGPKWDMWLATTQQQVGWKWEKLIRSFRSQLTGQRLKVLPGTPSYRPGQAASQLSWTPEAANSNSASSFHMEKFKMNRSLKLNLLIRQELREQPDQVLNPPSGIHPGGLHEQLLQRKDLIIFSPKGGWGWSNLTQRFDPEWLRLKGASALMHSTSMRSSQ